MANLPLEDHSTLDPRFEDIPLLDSVPEEDVGDLPERSVPALLRAGSMVLGAPTVTRGTSGLNARHRTKARDMAMQAAHLGAKNAWQVHYTQGRLRWSGINGNMKAWQGHYPKYADCSAYVTWCLWNGLDHFNVRDVVNGLRWHAGFTGTILTHGVRVRGERIRGDLVIYGNRWPGRHVAIYIGGGQVISHGSESGPFRLSVNYRRDLYQTRRFI